LPLLVAAGLSGLTGWGGRAFAAFAFAAKDVLDLLAAGATPEEVLADYPYLEAEDIDAVLEFAAA
jgi:uncharacterized protein (DUF433 family)